MPTTDKTLDPIEVCKAIIAERNELRAEVERLRQVYEHDMTLAAAEGQADYEECRRLKAEVARLKSAVTDLGVLHITAHAEVERLKAENRGLVETIGEWQEIHGTFVAK